MKLNLNLIALALILLNYSCSKSTSSSGTSSSGTTTPPVDSIAKSLKVGLVAWYPFTGNALDSSGSGNHGTPYGAALTADRFGNYNSAYYFDGTSYIDLLSAPLKKNQDYSICAWVKTNNYNELYIISCLDTTRTGTNYAGVLLNFGRSCSGQSGHVRSDAVFHGFGACYSTVSGLADNNWHFIGITDTAGKRQLFVDGEPSGAPDFKLRSAISKSVDPISGLITSNCNKCTIGALFDDPVFITTYWRYFFGTIDDIRFYNRKLSLTEMSYLYTHK
jgi:hypothetical protein